MKSFGVGTEYSEGILAGIEALPAWKRLREVSTTTTSPMVTPTNQQEACDPRVPLKPQVCNSGEQTIQSLMQLEGLSSVGLLLQGPPRGQKRKADIDGLCSIEETKWYLRKRLLQAYPQLREKLQMLCSNEDFNQQLTKDIADEVYAKNKRQGNCSRKPALAANLSTPIGNGGEIEVSRCLHSTLPSLKKQDLPLAQKNIGLGFSKDWIKDVADMVVEDLNQFGICVVDDFLGTQWADKVFEDVNGLYNKGGFQDGTVVSQINQAQTSTKKIRGDQITWVSGSDNVCDNTRQLVALLDAVIYTASKHTKPGKIGKYNITTRTRAMVACYPGSGAHYVKHVDNPNGDGRCITTIYYLNKHWQKDDGGVLRLYPEDSLHEVAEIEPLFDRMVFFWSDRRNPHEVLPAKMPRFSITVWYLNQDEREAYISRRISKD